MDPVDILAPPTLLSIVGIVAAAIVKVARLRAKFVLILSLTLAISASAGRRWAFLLLGLMGIAALIVHAWWLPRPRRGPFGERSQSISSSDRPTVWRNL